MNKRLKKAVSLTVTSAMLISTLPVFAASKTADWAMYVYMCGADLESDAGSATSDIIEMLSADIPDNVRVIVMTGGANEWDPNKDGETYNETVGYDAYITPDAAHNQIYEIDNDKMTLLKTYDTYMNMSDPATAEMFFKDAFNYAPAQHTMIDFWDHGGALDGAEFDERINEDFMRVRGIADVMETAKNANGGKNIDIVSFDACLMSTIEVGYTLSPYADYLVASEEVEPENGWYYGFLSMFSESEGVPSAVDVGEAVVDYYAYSQNEAGDWSKSMEYTLALTDLSKMSGLVTAFDALAEDMLEAMDDPKSRIEMMRIAESTKGMYEGTGMIDLYDFVYRLRNIDSLTDAASRVIELLGMPPGADNEDYNGCVSSDNHVGNVLGNDPAVIYRGAGYNFNNCVGMSVFYPVINYDFTASEAPELIERYKNFGVSEEYPLYIMSIMELADEAALYSGQIQDAYDEETGLFNMRVETADELDLVKNINYVTTFTEDSESYMLEKEMLTEGWEEDKFSKAPYETWYSVNDKPITANIDGHENYMDTEGYEVYNYAIPAVTVDENGEEISVELNCMYLDAPDLTAVADNDIAKCNKMLVVGVTPVSDDEIAPRVLDPDDEMQIKLMLAEYDPESCSVTGYKTYDEAISLTALDEDTYILPCEKKVLVNNDNVSYISYFEVTDVQNNVYLSDRMEYDSFQNTDAGYTDVSSDAWYAQSVKYVTEKGLMSGIGNNKFAPETPLSRNMLVTILYRMEGEPTVTAKGSFKDILPGSYYENAVEWAAENGIVSGYTADRFEPYADITREQLATILWRYAKHKGIDVSVGENTAILGYTDAADVSGYAVPAMQWACGAGIISGIGGSLVPNGSATRAQTAVILERMN